MHVKRVLFLLSFVVACVLWSLRNAAPTPSSTASDSELSLPPQIGRASSSLRQAERSDDGSIHSKRPRVILLMTAMHNGGSPLWYFGTTEMANPFLSGNCAYSDCVVTSNRSYVNEAALVVFAGPAGGNQCCGKTSTGVSCLTHRDERFDMPSHSPTNAFVFYLIEAPTRSRRECLLPLDDVVNYTYSYKSDSDVLKRHGTVYRLPERQVTSQVSDFYHSSNRTVLWYVSNCDITLQAKLRMQYAVELRKYIDVDIYGRCSNASDGCHRGDEQCASLFRRGYKFYLAFENSHCDDYVTEKFYKALLSGNVPIVRGLPRAQYEKLAPPRSFIHADDFASPKELAAYLRHLTASPDAYNGYHAWRSQYGVGSADDQCKLCELASLRLSKGVRVSDWWNVESNCRAGGGVRGGSR